MPKFPMELSQAASAIPGWNSDTQGGTVLCPAHLLIAHLCFSLAQLLKKELLVLY